MNHRSWELQNKKKGSKSGQRIWGLAGLSLANAKLLLSDIRTGSGTTEVSLWVKNLTDKAYKQNVIDFGPGFGNLHIANFGTPRTYGLQVLFRW